MSGEQTITRYLLEELSEQERIEFEESYFTDSRLFDRVQKAENDLLDDYARGDLPSSLRRRIEEKYLANPERSERLRFAEALVTRVDVIKTSGPTVTVEPSAWAGFVDRLRGRAPAFPLSFALAALLIFVAGLWLFISTTTRLRQELNEAQTARSLLEQHERELQQQIADKQARTDQLAGELDRLRSEVGTTGTGSKPPRSLVASLILSVGDVRGAETGAPAKLVITAATEQARLQLKLKDKDYPSYDLVLQAADGKQVFKHEGLVSSNKASPTLVVSVPAKWLTDSDYLLVLRGVTRAGDSEDVSKWLIRVEKK
jgi:hypothetical protein